MTSYELTTSIAERWHKQSQASTGELQMLVTWRSWWKTSRLGTPARSLRAVTVSISHQAEGAETMASARPAWMCRQADRQRSCGRMRPSY
jgi:hypothetical protein